MPPSLAAARLRILNGVTVFCPRIRLRRATRQGIVWVTEAMFPGYLFARFKLVEMYRQDGFAHGVSGIVRFADRYPTIEEGLWQCYEATPAALRFESLIMKLPKEIT